MTPPTPLPHAPENIMNATNWKCILHYISFARALTRNNHQVGTGQVTHFNIVARCTRCSFIFKDQRRLQAIHYVCKNARQMLTLFLLSLQREERKKNVMVNYHEIFAAYRKYTYFWQMYHSVLCVCAWKIFTYFFLFCLFVFIRCSGRRIFNVILSDSSEPFQQNKTDEANA